jgi:HEAT repeat protein
VRGCAALLLLLGAAAAGELEDARALLASRRARDQLAAIRKLAEIDSKGAIDALASAIKRSGREIDRLGKHLDKNDRNWEKAIDKVFDLEERGKYGTDAYRRARYRQGELEREWKALNRDARLHLAVLHEAGVALKRFRSAEAVAAIEQGARSHPHPLVRMLYIGGLAHPTHASSLETLVELVTSEKDPRVRAQALRGLVAWAPKGWETAAAAAHDSCWAVRRGAIQALAYASPARAVPELIEAAGRESGELELTAFSYLRQITKARVGNSYRAWKDWWGANAAAPTRRRKSPRVPRPASGPSRGSSTSPSSRRTSSSPSTSPAR